MHRPEIRHHRSCRVSFASVEGLEGGAIVARWGGVGGVEGEGTASEDDDDTRYSKRACSVYREEVRGVRV